MRRLIEDCRRCKKKHSNQMSGLRNHSGYCSMECKNLSRFKKSIPTFKPYKKKERRIHAPPPMRKAVAIHRRFAQKHEQAERVRRYSKARIHSMNFLNSREWREKRFEAFARYGNRCQCCGKKPPEVVLHVDHIKPRATHPELCLDITNLQILCEDCNIGKGAKYEIDFRTSHF